MKEIFYNYDYLETKDINNIVKRAKAIIVNSNNEIMLGKSNNTFQILGGHVEENETFDECLIREIKEESGINLEYRNFQPFFVIRYYTKDYPNIGLNSEYIINYYIIKTDLKPDLNNINLTEAEKEGFFEFCYIGKLDVLNILEDNLKITPNKNTVKDTIEVVKEYLEKDEYINFNTQEN